MSKLKPCPFCGRGNKSISKSEPFVICGKVLGCMVHCSYCDAKHNEDMWNNRPIEYKQKELLDEAVDMLDTIRCDGSYYGKEVDVSTIDDFLNKMKEKK